MKKERRIPGRYTILLHDTTSTAAWRAMSHGAKVLYVTLKKRYNSTADNNGRVFISQRDATREIRSDSGQIARWFRELQHYGFIVQTKAGSLGIGGKGTAPHWRLTECDHAGKPATKDFLQWDGEPFRDAPRKRLCRKEISQHPVRKNPNTSVRKFPNITGRESRSEFSQHKNLNKHKPLPSSASASASSDGRLPWLTPTVVEVTDPLEAEIIRAACDEDQP